MKSSNIFLAAAIMLGFPCVCADLVFGESQSLSQPEETEPKGVDVEFKRENVADKAALGKLVLLSNGFKKGLSKEAKDMADKGELILLDVSMTEEALKDWEKSMENLQSTPEESAKSSMYMTCEKYRDILQLEEGGVALLDKKGNPVACRLTNAKSVDDAIKNVDKLTEELIASLPTRLEKAEKLNKTMKSNDAMIDLGFILLCDKTLEIHKDKKKDDLEKNLVLKPIGDLMPIMMGKMADEKKIPVLLRAIQKWSHHHDFKMIFMQQLAQSKKKVRDAGGDPDSIKPKEEPKIPEDEE